MLILSFFLALFVHDYYLLVIYNHFSSSVLYSGAVGYILFANVRFPNLCSLLPVEVEQDFYAFFIDRFFVSGWK